MTRARWIQVKDFYWIAAFDVALGFCWLLDVGARPTGYSYQPANELLRRAWPGDVTFYPVHFYGALMVALATAVCLTIRLDKPRASVIACVLMIIYWAWWALMWAAAVYVYRKNSLAGAVLAGKGIYSYYRLMNACQWVGRQH